MGQCVSSKAATYPGNKRVTKPAYQPSADEYKQVNSTTAVANAHFVTCAGGNALKLVGKPNRAEDTTTGGGKVGAQYISVTLPPGVQSGDIIHVRAPDGRMNAITVPDGMGPGSTFTVEFSADIPPPPKEEDLTPGVYVPTVMAEPEVETGVYAGSYGDGMETSVAKPTTGPYVPAYAAK
eukprot:CAMPEP_0172300090 /NCGR_PEP_ID=MMETSP1058-20130122/2270_1 /TAXON_ID=83371 /ORGANISM="Detonula confervacea, Strain CCMP 353" /LENGTH=179 /DNA_ID=CAMNT_0013009779 /DNA_START=171 /DNA_END=710 /DNA_ORIENTATION=+